MWIIRTHDEWFVSGLDHLTKDYRSCTKYKSKLHALHECIVFQSRHGIGCRVMKVIGTVVEDEGI